MSLLSVSVSSLCTAAGASLLLLCPFAPLQAPIPPTPVPGGPGTGVYSGPGDTLPPPCTGPNCPQPPPPPMCPAPCTSGFDFLPCYSGCHLNKQPLHMNWLLNWPEVPACMFNQPARIYEITVGDLLNACTISSQGVNTYPIANVCLQDTCPTGIDALFVYETIPFRWYENGVPTSSGGTLPICGLGYDVRIEHDNGSCTSVGGYPYYLSNSTHVPMHCATDTHDIKLQIDCSCLQTLLSQWAWLGYYSPFGASYINNSTVVFSVAVKCCTPSGGYLCP